MDIKLYFIKHIVLAGASMHDIGFITGIYFLSNETFFERVGDASVTIGVFDNPKIIRKTIIDLADKISSYQRKRA
jgi:hypothetical protein